MVNVWGSVLHPWWPATRWPPSTIPSLNSYSPVFVGRYSPSIGWCLLVSWHARQWRTIIPSPGNKLTVLPVGPMIVSLSLPTPPSGFLSFSGLWYTLSLKGYPLWADSPTSMTTSSQIITNGNSYIAACLPWTSSLIPLTISMPSTSLWLWRFCSRSIWCRACMTSWGRFLGSSSAVLSIMTSPLCSGSRVVKLPSWW